MLDLVTSISFLLPYAAELGKTEIGRITGRLFLTASPNMCPRCYISPPNSNSYSPSREDFISPIGEWTS